MGLLEISVADGEAGPVLILSGEADLTTVAALTDALSAQLAAGARHLTVDLSRLRFADAAVIRALVRAGRRLKGRGGGRGPGRGKTALAVWVDSGGRSVAYLDRLVHPEQAESPGHHRLRVR